MCRVLHLKGLLTAQAFPEFQGKLVQAAGFWSFLCNASCLPLSALLAELDTTVDSCAVLPQPVGLFRVSLAMSSAGSTAAKLTTSLSLKLL